MFGQVSPIELIQPAPRLSDVDLSLTLDDEQEYQQKLRKWQKRMLDVQLAYYHQGRRAIIVYEGWDASGKGGSIRRLTARLDPRGFQVYPIAAPSTEEKQKHYLYRFQNKQPSAGNIVIFDRSYYGRVLVERVEGLASEAQWQRAYQEINEFERSLIDDGVRIIKLFFHISPEQQKTRFIDRLENPTKCWKLTEEDLRNRNKWSNYQVAIDQMLAKTSTELAPWHLIAAEHKWYARVNSIKTIVKQLELGVDIDAELIDQTLMERARNELY